MYHIFRFLQLYQILGAVNVRDQHVDKTAADGAEYGVLFLTPAGHTDAARNLLQRIERDACHSFIELLKRRRIAIRVEIAQGNVPHRPARRELLENSTIDIARLENRGMFRRGNPDPHKDEIEP